MRGRPEVHPKSWGHELWLENCPEYCGKILTFRAGGRTSYHYHRRKLETLYVAKGKILLRLEDEMIPMEVGEKYQVQRFQLHQIEAVEDSEIVEVSTEHFESDSYRVEHVPN